MDPVQIPDRKDKGKKGKNGRTDKVTMGEE